MIDLRVAALLLVAPAVLTAQATTDSARLAAMGLFRAPAVERVPGPWGAGGVSREIPVVGVDTGAVRGSYWKEGGLIGGLGLGVPLAVAFSGLCDNGPCYNGALLGLVIGGFVGGSAGALVGSLFPKRQRRSP